MRTATFCTGSCLLGVVLSGCFLVPTVPVECSARRPCPSGQACDPESSTCVDATEPPLAEPEPPLCERDCTPCRVHADCPSLVCDVYLTTALGGSCLPLSALVYVDNRDGACMPGGDGDSPATALCTLTEGLARASTTGRKALRVMASSRSYGPVVLADRGLTLYGPAGEGGRAQLGGAPGIDAVTVTPGAQVVVDGFDITRGEAGVSCTGGDADTRVTLRRSRITAAADLGLLVNNCRLEVDRVLLSSNGKGALVTVGTRPYRITNSFIVRHRSTALPTVKMASSAPGTFRFNTVVDNSSTLAAAIDCSGQPLRISDSIVVRNQRVGGSQLQNGCQVSNTVVGPFDLAPGSKLLPEFARVGDVDYGLSSDSHVNRQCCIDRAEATQGRDYFGTPRPVGPRADIGAHEVK
ncbi:MAG: hypothetical protein RMK29_00645 [Myxococcales bacterium]|nr:hypothetical protein [Myxococcota bacterium]MDW8280185.1 hypothetical protein [Myxococcales bacterium]